ncbi:hypothetical protein SAMN05428988_2454 [Chitinophaga sp. YR573]|uniref:hypothetical protein n=1 Tax=Chitinophaga sp. YR573 TaxID=1881040 RepID=UPI0008AEF0B1|nr:hypothetical protein [Chitinophaga sp. YR573]SEW14430.1 hypothetical protein SAMN05428988_2454 [Chitinophaga sp. YR573]
MSLLIVTSTVYVNSSFTALTDPAVRKEQYVDSILFYLEKPWLTAMIVCDNSGFDFSTVATIQQLAASRNKQIELLSFEVDSDRVLKSGKGYGEGAIMNFILDNSHLIQQYDFFYKVTGRVKVTNIDEIVAGVTAPVTYFEKVGVNLNRNSKAVDTRFYRCSKDVFIRYLSNAFLNVDDSNGYYLEHAYFDALNENGLHYYYFDKVPIYKGVSGTTGLSLSHMNFKERIVYIINSIHRIIYYKVMNRKSKS